LTYVADTELRPGCDNWEQIIQLFIESFLELHVLFINSFPNLYEANYVTEAGTELLDLTAERFKKRGSLRSSEILFAQ
jgi:hypothetical protein